MIEHHVATLPDQRADVRDHLQRLAAEAAAYEACKAGSGSTPCPALAAAVAQRDAALKALLGRDWRRFMLPYSIGFVVGFSVAVATVVWML